MLLSNYRFSVIHVLESFLKTSALQVTGLWLPVPEKSNNMASKS